MTDNIKVEIKLVIISTSQYENKDIRKADITNFSFLGEQSEDGNIHLLSFELAPGVCINTEVMSLLSKCNINSTFVKQLKTYNKVNSTGGSIIIISYLALANNIEHINSTDRLSICRVETVKRNLETFQIDDIATQYNIDDIDKLIVKEALKNISNWAKGGSDIAFEILPELFTINELESVYTLLLGYNPPSFRRVTLPKLEETDQIRQNKGFRPAKLFRAKERMKECLDSDI